MSAELAVILEEEIAEGAKHKFPEQTIAIKSSRVFFELSLPPETNFEASCGFGSVPESSA